MALDPDFIRTHLGWSPDAVLCLRFEALMTAATELIRSAPADHDDLVATGRRNLSLLALANAAVVMAFAASAVAEGQLAAQAADAALDDLLGHLDAETRRCAVSLLDFAMHGSRPLADR